MALLKKIVEKLQKVHRLGFSNAWFIFKKRCRDRQNRVNPISLSETDKKKILADSKRKRTSIAVLLRLGETFDVGDKEAAAAVEDRGTGEKSAGGDRNKKKGKRKK